MQDNNIDYMDMTPSMRKYKPKNKTTTSLYRVEFLKTIQILNTHTHTLTIVKELPTQLAKEQDSTLKQKKIIANSEFEPRSETSLVQDALDSTVQGIEDLFAYHCTNLALSIFQEFPICPDASIISFLLEYKPWLLPPCFFQLKI